MEALDSVWRFGNIFELPQRKSCELLEMDEFLTMFPLLKSPQKIYKHDKMWDYICRRLGWKFIKTGIEDDAR